MIHHCRECGTKRTPRIRIGACSLLCLVERLGVLLRLFFFLCVRYSWRFLLPPQEVYCVFEGLSFCCRTCPTSVGNPAFFARSFLCVGGLTARYFAEPYHLTTWAYASPRSKADRSYQPASSFPAARCRAKFHRPCTATASGTACHPSFSPPCHIHHIENAGPKVTSIKSNAGLMPRPVPSPVDPPPYSRRHRTNPTYPCICLYV